MKTTSEKTRKMVQLAILTAIALIFAFTPIGYLKIGLIEITLMIIPVSVGAILLGPAAGAFLGAVFGVTSFIQCFGMSAFGVFLLSLNPYLTLFVCLVPRVLCGWLTGVIFKALQKIDKTHTVSYIVSSLATPLMNTLFFMSCIIIFFWRNSAFLDQMSAWQLPVDSVWAFLVAFVGTNGVVEAIVGFIAGAAISKVLSKILVKPAEN